MFTGIVEHVGEVTSFKSSFSGMTKALRIKASQQWKLSHGDSISVNGCCLTVANFSTSGSIGFDLSFETLERTNLSSIMVGSHVNLERALKLTDRLGGHIVTGHIDCSAPVVLLEPRGEIVLLKISVSPSHRENLIPKGSICLDGVSLTINAIDDCQNELIVSFVIIPSTLEKTNFLKLKPGQDVNVEFDLVGKYIIRQIETQKRNWESES